MGNEAAVAATWQEIEGEKGEKLTAVAFVLSRMA